jgi:hypothetical protein
MDFKFEPGVLSQLALDLQLDPEDEIETFSLDEARLKMEALKHALNVKNIDGVDTADGAQWMETFDELIAEGWKWKVAAYIAWASSPRIGRKPATQDELARDVLGLTSDRVIAKWRRNNPTIDRVISVLQAAPLLKYRADIFDALGWSASQKDHRSNPDRKLAAEMMHDYEPRARLDINDSRKAVDPVDMTEEELAKIEKQSGTKLKENPK